MRKGIKYFFIIFIGMMIVGLYLAYTMDSQLKRVAELSDEQEKNIVQVIKDIGIDGNIEKVEHDELLDGLYSETGKGYRISISDSEINNLILYLKENKDIEAINWADINFYKDGEIKDNIKDYTLTSSQRAQYQNRAEELIKSILISPATAKFPNSNQWNIRINKGIVFMQSFVDSQNAFGAVIRSDFKIKYDTKTATIISLIIDGEEKIKQPKPSKTKNKNKKK
ncbi:hypothetical protein [Fusobacterium nucleatum]|uniref:hypothetical protein n=1 Tax=Fusobacterium nucleatum TaxID=851 RepID=UPI0030D2FB05